MDIKKYLIILAFPLNLFSQDTLRQESLLWLGAGIELVNSIVNKPETKYTELIHVKSNAKKGQLTKRYNRWFRRKKITPEQYNYLIKDLYEQHTKIK